MNIFLLLALVAGVIGASWFWVGRVRVRWRGAEAMRSMRGPASPPDFNSREQEAWLRVVSDATLGCLTLAGGLYLAGYQLPRAGSEVESLVLSTERAWSYTT